MGGSSVSVIQSVVYIPRFISREFGSNSSIQQAVTSSAVVLTTERYSQRSTVVVTGPRSHLLEPKSPSLLVERTRRLFSTATPTRTRNTAISITISQKLQEFRAEPDKKPSRPHHRLLLAMPQTFPIVNEPQALVKIEAGLCDIKGLLDETRFARFPCVETLVARCRVPLRIQSQDAQIFVTKANGISP